MSVCGSSDTPVPEMGREMLLSVEGNIVVWGTKSMRIRAGMRGEGALPEFGGSKRGCCAAQVVIGGAHAARWDWGTHQPQVSQALSAWKVVLLLSDRENRLGLGHSSCSALGTILSEGTEMGESFSRSSCPSWELVGQEDVAGVGEHPGGGVIFWDGGAKQGAVLPMPTACFRAFPGAVPAFQGSEACSWGLIAHLSPEWSDSLPSHLPAAL